MLDAFLCLDLGVDASCCGGFGRISSESCRGSEYSSLPAAAAGSEGLFTPSVGLLDAIGLLLRRESLCLVVGERERRSNLEVRFGSGSVWSKRDRFVERRSSSAISI